MMELEDLVEVDPLGQVNEDAMHVTPGMRMEPRPSEPGMRLVFRIIAPGQPDNSVDFVDVGGEDTEAIKEWALAIKEAVEDNKVGRLAADWFANRTGNGLGTPNATHR